MTEVLCMPNKNPSVLAQEEEEEEKHDAAVRKSLASMYLTASSHQRRREVDDDERSVGSQSSQRSRSRSRSRSRVGRHLRNRRTSTGNVGPATSTAAANDESPAPTMVIETATNKPPEAAIMPDEEVCEEEQAAPSLLANSGKDARDGSEASGEEDLLKDLGVPATISPTSVMASGTTEDHAGSDHSSNKSSSSSGDKKSKKKKKSKKSSELSESKHHKKCDKKGKKDKDRKKSRSSSEDDLGVSMHSTLLDNDPEAKCIYDKVEKISCQIKIHQGQDMVAKDRTLLGKLKSSDPYVEVYRNLPTTFVNRTKTKMQTLAPVYEEQFEMSWTHKELLRSISKSSRAKVILKVWDYDKMSGADSMGECHITLPGPKEKKKSIDKEWFNVVDHDDHGDEKHQGRLQVSIRVKYEMRH